MAKRGRNSSNEEEHDSQTKEAGAGCAAPQQRQVEATEAIGLLPRGGEVMRIKYVVRHGHGKSWAVDRLEFIGEHHFIRANTRYFPTEEEARAFKQRKEEEARS